MRPGTTAQTTLSDPFLFGLTSNMSRKTVRVTRTSIDQSHADGRVDFGCVRNFDKGRSFVAWLAENRVLRSRCNSAAVWPTIPTSALRAARFAAAYAWWIGLPSTLGENRSGVHSSTLDP
jgi:hypothetical protein